MQCDQEIIKTIEYFINSNPEGNYVQNVFFPIVLEQQNNGTNASSGWISTTPTFTDWANVATPYNEQSWNPAFNNKLVDFVQNRDYDQDQEQFEQAREFNSFTSIYRNLGDLIKHEQTIINNEPRNVVSEISSWVNDNGHYDCDTWTPNVTTKVYGEEFTQLRNCQQDQTANISYKVDSTEVETGLTNKIITEQENQQATGTNSDSGWADIISTFTTWVNQGIAYEQGIYSPVINSQLADFSQSRSYKKDQQQFEQKREQNSYTSAIRNNGAAIEKNQTLTPTQNRTVSVTLANWVNNGTAHACATNWTPASSTQIYGVEFTQTKSCTQDQKRNITYKEGSTTLEVKEGIQSIAGQVTQQATGTNTDSGWSDIVSTFTSWTAYGENYTFTAYSPAYGNQTSNYVQSRTYNKNQEQYE
jgi:hypothetical protein